MQAVNSTMSDIGVPCNNCHDLQCQLSATKWKIACYHEQFIQQEQKYEINLQEIAADRQKIYEYQTARLDNKTKQLEIAEQSLAHEFKCHQYTETSLRDTRKTLAYERERNTTLMTMIQLHRPLTASELEAMMKEHLQSLIDALQHTLKELKEAAGGEDGIRGNRELDVE